jgi:hypothetical protein
MRRLIWTLSAVLLIAGVIDTRPAAAQQQTVNFYIGGFVPRDFDARGTNDVLFANTAQGKYSLLFDMKDFHGVTFGGEWLVGLGDLFDAGLGIGFYQRTAPAIYENLTKDNGSEIEQDLKLRIVPFTATVRFLPLGHHAPIRPYIGGGVGVMSWRYSETGEFVDSNDDSTFRDSFTAKGTKSGPIVLGGVSFPLDAAVFGFEVRWQGGKGDLPRPDPVLGGFNGSKIDLGGMNYLFTVGYRF